MKNIEVKKVVKFLFFISIFSLILHFSIYIIYLLLDKTSLQFLVRETLEKTKIRYSFFFVHPNVFAAYVFWTITMYYYLNFDKLNILSYIYTFLLALFIYVFPNSKTSALIIMLLIVLTIFKKKFRKNINVKLVFVIVFLFCLLCLVFIEKPIVRTIDNILTTRITLGRIIYENYGIHLFGANIQNSVKIAIINGQYYNNIKIIDSMYYTLLFNYGIISVVIFAWCLFKHKFVKNEDLFFVLVLMYGITETICLSPIIAFPLLFLSEREKKYEK